MPRKIDDLNAAAIQQYKENPVYFSENVLHIKPWEKQKQILNAVRDYPRVTVRSCNGIGKCGYAYRFIDLYDGTHCQMKDLIGKTFNIPTFDTERKFAVAHATDNGIASVYRVTTSSNRQLEVTGNHKLYRAIAARNRGIKPKVVGWTEVVDLTIDDLLLVPTKLEVNGMISRDIDEVKLCGYLIGDGGTTINPITFTQAAGIAKTEFVNIVTSMNCGYRMRDNYGLLVVAGTFHGENRVLDLVKQWKMFGVKSKDKKFPAFVWTLPNDQLAVFLNRYFACDGWATVRIDGSHKNAHIGITSASEQMIKDVEIAMLRMGISGRTRYKRVKCNGKYFDSWEWAVFDRVGINRFAEVVGIYGKEDAVNRCVEVANSRKFDVMWQYINAPEGYHWEFIKSIEYIGEHPTVCISVDDTHTYVTNFVEHNSHTAAQVIMWFLYTHKNSIVLNTAPTWRQVEKLIWKEIRINHRRAGNLGGTLAPKSPELQIDQDRWYASGISTNQPDRFQGWHAKDILVVVDEAAGVNEEIFDAISGVLTSENAKMLMLGNPTSIGGTFYKSFSSGEYKTFHISAWMTPNFTHFKITRQDIIDGTWKDKMGDKLAPYPWLIQPKWVASQYKMWGLDHPAWQARIEGNFPSVGEHTLLPLDWIEAARNRGLDKDAKS